MTAPDQIKAGKYELIAVSWDQTTSKPGEPYDFIRHVQGDIVTLDVAEARRLVLGGAVVKPGEREKAAAAQALAQYQFALAQLPDEVRAQLATQTADPQVEQLKQQLEAEKARADAAEAAAKKAAAAAKA